MKRSISNKHYLVCMNNEKYEASLEKRKIYSVVPDRAAERVSWVNSLIRVASKSDIVFLDPDNGLEVKSVPYGRKKSSKYVYRREVGGLWSEGKTLLIYQHFPREKRDIYIQRMISTINKYTSGSRISAFTTSGVTFFLVLQPKHRKHYDAIVISVNNNWNARGGIQIDKINKNV